MAPVEPAVPLRPIHGKSETSIQNPKVANPFLYPARPSEPGGCRVASAARLRMILNAISRPSRLFRCLSGGVRRLVTFVPHLAEDGSEEQADAGPDEEVHQDQYHTDGLLALLARDDRPGEQKGGEDGETGEAEPASRVTSGWSAGPLRQPYRACDDGRAASAVTDITSTHIGRGQVRHLARRAGPRPPQHRLATMPESNQSYHQGGGDYGVRTSARRDGAPSRPRY